MRKSVLATVMVATLLPAAPALADPPRWAPAHGYRERHHEDRRYARYYDNRGYYSGPRWRGNDGRYRCRRADGTVGLLIGGVAGALVGRAIDTDGDRAVGTIVGAAGGALLGREVERGSARCR